MERYECQGIDRKEAMKLVAKDRGISKRDVYQALLKQIQQCFFAASVIAYYICKWLDGEEQAAQHDESPGVASPGLSICQWTNFLQLRNRFSVDIYLDDFCVGFQR